VSQRDESPFEGPQGPDVVNPAHSFDAYRFARERFFERLRADSEARRLERKGLLLAGAAGERRTA
jgi:hypothetical protein